MLPPAASPPLPCGGQQAQCSVPSTRQSLPWGWVSQASELGGGKAAPV